MLGALIAIGIPTMAFAQKSVNTNLITIGTEIINGLSISVQNPTLDFGSLVSGTTPAAVDPTSASNIPYFIVTGEGGHAVNVSYPNTVTLSGPGSSTMTFYANLVGDDTTNQSGASAFGPSIILSGSPTGLGYYYFWLGGNVGSIPVGQTRGRYNCTFTVTVSY